MRMENPRRARYSDEMGFTLWALVAVGFGLLVCWPMLVFKGDARWAAETGWLTLPWMLAAIGRGRR